MGRWQWQQLEIVKELSTQHNPDVIPLTQGTINLAEPCPAGIQLFYVGTTQHGVTCVHPAEAYNPLL